MQLITLTEDKILLRCDFIDREIAKSIIRSRKWDPNLKAWTYHLSLDNVTRVMRAFPDATLSHDELTQRIHKSLVTREDTFSEENKLLEDAKAGKIPITFPCTGTPFKHQERALSFLMHTPYGALFLDTGTGKTYIICQLMRYLFSAAKIRRALIVCPLSLVHATWVDHLKRFAPELTYQPLWEPRWKKKDRLAALDNDAQVYIANYDTARLLAHDLFEHGFDLVVIDESSKIKSHKSLITKSVLKIGSRATYRYIMSASPAPQGIGDLFSQFLFLDKEVLGGNYYDFEAKYFDIIPINDRHGNFIFPKKTPKPHAVDAIYKRTAPRSIRIPMSECLDLPPQTFINVPVPMSATQQRHYESMRDDLYTQHGEAIYTVQNSLSSLMKLRQILVGAILDKEGNVIDFEPDCPKFIALDELVESIAPTNKMIIYGQFQFEIAKYIERYKDYNPASYFGLTPNTQKLPAIERFQNDPECRLFISNPASTAHGLNLFCANYMVFPSLSYSFEHYYQSLGRIYRNGQTEKTFYYHLLTPGTIDMIIMRALRNKENVQDYILNGKFDRDKIHQLMDNVEDA